MTCGVAVARVAGLAAVVLASLGGFGSGLAAQTPTVTGLSVNSPSTSNFKELTHHDQFWLTEVIRVKVAFSDSVDVTGTPHVVLGIGSCTDCFAEYASGTGTDTLLFAYEVLRGDTDSTGISIAADALKLNSGTINASGSGAAASLNLGTHAFTDDAARKVQTIDNNNATGANTGVVNILQNDPASGDTYKLGETIWITLVFSRNVSGQGQDWRQHFKVLIRIGDKVRRMDYDSGASTTQWVFRYAVQANDLDADGYTIEGRAFIGGVISHFTSRNMGRQAIVNDGDRKVDGSQGVPGITSVTLGAPAGGDTHFAGDAVEATVKFTQPVAVDTTGGKPQLGLQIGANTRQAPYVSGTGTTDLVFRYVVVAADSDTDGLSTFGTALGLNGGTITDTVSASPTNVVRALGDAALGAQSGHRVDGSAAMGVVGLALASRPASGDTYGLSEAIEARVTFNRSVTVTGTPQLDLLFGTDTVQADYVSGGGGTALTFRHVVASGDVDADGLSVDTLKLNSGTIVDARSGGAAAGRALGAHVAITDDGNHKVDGSVEVAPAVTGVSFASAPAAGGVYELGERIEVEVTFDKLVDVTTTDGTPSLALEIGTATRQAGYASGTGTSALTFSYEVAAGDEDADGASVTVLALNGGAIAISGGTAAAELALGSHAIVNDGAHVVDAGTYVTGLALSDPVVGDTYELRDTIKVVLTFSKAVDVTGTPQLGLTVTSARTAPYASGTGTTELTFQYVVQSVDLDNDGLSIGASALGLNGGTITTSGTGSNAGLSLAGHTVTNSAGHKVYGNLYAPAVSGLSMSSVPAAAETYAATDTIEAEVTFNRRVNVVTTGGTPQLALGIGANTRQAAYASGTGTNVLKFRYVVVAADADPDGIEVAAGALTLNSGAINDVRRTVPLAASLGLGTHALSAQAGHKVDGTIAPASVSGAAITSRPASGDTYGLGERIAVEVTFDRAVAVTGSPQLEVEITGVLRPARYASGSGTTALAFHYWVRGAGSGGAGPGGVDQTTAGVSVSAGALSLNGGTIKNVANPERDFSAALGLGSHALTNDPSHKVDGSVEAAPVVTGVEVASRPTGPTGYGSGAGIVLRVSFSRAVTVTGAPRLAVVIGIARRRAAYVSGSGTDVLEFRYRVVPSDADRNGFSVPANALELAGGAIGLSGGSEDAELSLGSHALADVTGHAVDGGTGADDPRFERREYVFELAENVAGPVELGEVSAADPYDSDVSYSLGDGARGFEVNEWGGELRYVGSGLDAESEPKRVMKVLATAEDGREGEALVIVHVLDENEAPAFAEDRLAFRLPENVAGPLALGVAEASDPDEGDALSYALASGDAGLFEVDAASGEVRYVGDGEDYDGSGPKSWALEVVATDRAGLSAVAAVVVSLGDENEAPAFADSTYAFELPENAAGPVVVGTVRAIDPDASDRLVYELASGGAGLFEVDAASGAVRYVGPGEDAETDEGPKSWALVVRATDGGGLSAEASVSVSLLDVNEAPAFEAERYEWEFDENVAGPLALGVVRASDPDRADTTLAYSLSGEGAALFEADAASGAVRYVGSGEDYEAGPTSWTFEVVATDGEGLQGRVPAEVTLLNVNEAPAFADSAYAFELAENQAGPVELGRVEASDEDADDELTYSLSGGGGRFEVDAASGAVRYVGSGEDYEAGPRSYELALRVTDAGGLSGEARGVVALLDVNEGPEAVGAMAPKTLEAYGAAAEEDLGQYFRDPDGDALSYAAESSAPSVAAVSVAAGRLSIAPQAIGVATVTVTARDPDGLEGTQTVAVTVEASRSERARALEAALTAFGRSVGTEAVDAIGGRLGVESSSVLGRSHVQLGSRSVGCGALGGEAASSCGWAQLARGASSLLGVQLNGPAAMAGPAGGSGGGSVSLDAVSLLFGDGSSGAQDGLASGFGGGGAYNGQQAPPEPGGGEQRGGLKFDPLSGGDLRSRSSFRLSFGDDGADAGARDAGAPQSAVGTGWTVWGQANAGAFESSPDDGLTVEGRTRSVYAGLDYGFGSGLLVGLAASRNTLASDFDSEINGAGAVDARLTNLYPYAHWSPREGLGLWGLVGAGRGSADLAETAGGRFRTDLTMRMLALGGRQELIGALALKADAFTVRITSEDGAGLAGVTAVAHRARLAPELAGQWTMGGGMAVRARFELGARYDRGDAETGLGAEAGAEFGFAHLGSGLSIDARGRTLLAHQKDQFREWGASFALRLQPGGEEGGLSFSLEPSWGEAASGTAALWQAQAGLGGLGGQERGVGTAAALAGAPGWTPDRLAMELGWGFVLPGGAQIAPFGRWSREGAAGYRLNAGTRWTALAAPGEHQAEGSPRRVQLTVDLFGEQAAVDAQPAQRRIGLLGRIAFR